MHRKADTKEMVNMSITQTLTRSIYTSFTTFVMVFVLYIMGVTSIREFALPLMVGIVCGAYSPLWYVIKTKYQKSTLKRKVIIKMLLQCSSFFNHS